MAPPDGEKLRTIPAALRGCAFSRDLLSAAGCICVRVPCVCVSALFSAPWLRRSPALAAAGALGPLCSLRALPALQARPPDGGAGRVERWRLRHLPRRCRVYERSSNEARYSLIYICSAPQLNMRNLFVIGAGAPAKRPTMSHCANGWKKAVKYGNRSTDYSLPQ